jgi:hypothetical protein
MQTFLKYRCTAKLAIMKSRNISSYFSCDIGLGQNANGHSPTQPTGRYLHRGPSFLLDGSDKLMHSISISA